MIRIPIHWDELTEGNKILSISYTRLRYLANEMSDLITCPDFMSGIYPYLSGSKVYNIYKYIPVSCFIMRIQ